MGRSKEEFHVEREIIAEQMQDLQHGRSIDEKKLDLYRFAVSAQTTLALIIQTFPLNGTVELSLRQLEEDARKLIK